MNGERRPRPRLPREGWRVVEALPDATPGTPWMEGQRRFRFAPGDVRAWSNLHDVEVVALHFWVDSRMPIASIDERERVVTLARRSIFRLTERHEPAPLARYYVENVFEALDAPGEWYLDRSSGALTYLPRDGEAIGSTELVAPRLPALVRFEGKPEAGRLVEHVVLRGLELRDAEPARAEGWVATWPHEDVAGAFQAAFDVPGAVSLRGARDVALEDLTIRGVGSYAIELGAGCRHDVVRRCDLGDLGAGGIKIGEPKVPADPALETGENTVADCHVHDGGRIHRGAVGIWVGQSAGNVIAHNLVHDLDFTGISVGWSWRYEPSAAARNVVEKNHVHHVGRGVLSDVGGIYTLGVQPGTVIRGNLIHDVTAAAYGAWGIYLDEGTSGVRVEGNVVHHAQSGGFFLHYGRDDVVVNNVFALSREGALMRGKEDATDSLVVERNVVFVRDGDALAWHWKTGRFRFDRNVYWDARGTPPRFAGETLEARRARGLDAGSIVADPRFVDPDRGDFALREGSPTRDVGFEPIDTSDVGPRRATSP